MISGLPVTKKELHALYAKLKRRWFKENPSCCVPGCTWPTQDLHHVRGRLGILLVIVELWRPLCRPHHDKLKQPGGVAWGRSLGLLPPAGGHNTVPPELKEKYAKQFA